MQQSCKDNVHELITINQNAFKQVSNNERLEYLHMLIDRIVTGLTNKYPHLLLTNDFGNL